jgi:CDP-Glycerol:Poly(glycerophosphate) glycerophosphotransferase
VAVDGAGTQKARPRRLWVAFVDPLPNRVFFDCGIVAGLRSALDDRLTALFPLHPKHIDPWRDQLAGLQVIEAAELMPVQVPLGPRIVRRADIFLDDHVGFHTLAVRTSLRHGFNRERWAHGHPIAFLDIDRAGHLPRWDVVDRGMAAWLFSGRRYVPAPLLAAMGADCEGLVVTNLQAHVSMPYLVAARRLGVPVVGYVASWDHTVGKGVVSPHLDLYVVQNEIMRWDLVRYHGIDPARITITGWPQTDVYYRHRPREAYEELLRSYDLDPEKPLVLFAGNTPDNAPYEGRLVERLLAWWQETGANQRFSLLFRPHPRDNRVVERFGAAAGVSGAAVQAPSYTDLEDLATLLQHADVVVANAGTILLDALVNDRPAVCVLWDEGAPEGERWADRNLVGDHYKQLAKSSAFLRAHDFDELIVGIDRALSQPGELASEREQIAREVVGEVDGKAGERVVEAIVSRLG